MSVFTPLGHETLEALLQRWNLRLVEARAAPHGIENSNYLLVTAGPDGGHQGHVLTVFEALDYAELPPLVALLSRLAATRLPVPEPLPDQRGRCIQMVEGKPAVLVPRLPGTHPGTPDTALCRAMGETLAQLHISAVDPRGGLGDAEQLERFAGQAPGAAATRVLSAWRRARGGLPDGLIHGDLFRDNALTEAGRITGLLDFYDAGAGTWLFDLAVCANDWAGEDPVRLDALLTGYERVRALTPDEHSHWRLALAAAALRFWLSRQAALARGRRGEGQVSKDPAAFEQLFRRRYEAWDHGLK